MISSSLLRKTTHLPEERFDALHMLHILGLVLWRDFLHFSKATIVHILGHECGILHCHSVLNLCPNKFYGVQLALEIAARDVCRFISFTSRPFPWLHL